MGRKGSEVSPSKRYPLRSTQSGGRILRSGSKDNNTACNEPLNDSPAAQPAARKRKSSSSPGSPNNSVRALRSALPLNDSPAAQPAARKRKSSSSPGSPNNSVRVLRSASKNKVDACSESLTESIASEPDANTRKYVRPSKAASPVSSVRVLRSASKNKNDACCDPLNNSTADEQAANKRKCVTPSKVGRPNNSVRVLRSASKNKNEAYGEPLNDNTVAQPSAKKRKCGSPLKVESPASSARVLHSNSKMTNETFNELLNDCTAAQPGSRKRKSDTPPKGGSPKLGVRVLRSASKKKDACVEPLNNVFPEAASFATGSKQLNASDLPLGDSEKNDYNPALVERHIVNEGEVDDLGLPSEDSEDDDFDPAGSDSSEDQENKSHTEESDFTSDSDYFCAEIAKSCRQSEVSASPLSNVNEENWNRAFVETELDQDAVLPVSSRRQIERLDYKKLYDKLKDHFEKDPYPSRATKENLAQELGLTFIQVDKWFASTRHSSRVAAAKKEKYTGNHITANSDGTTVDSSQVRAHNDEVLADLTADRNNLVHEEVMVQNNLDGGNKEDIPLSRAETEAEASGEESSDPSDDKEWSGTSASQKELEDIETDSLAAANRAKRLVRRAPVAVEMQNNEHTPQSERLHDSVNEQQTEAPCSNGSSSKARKYHFDPIVTQLPIFGFHPGITGGRGRAKRSQACGWGRPTCARAGERVWASERAAGRPARWLAGLRPASRAGPWVRGRGRGLLADSARGTAAFFLVRLGEFKASSSSSSRLAAGRSTLPSLHSHSSSQLRCQSSSYTTTIRSPMMSRTRRRKLLCPCCHQARRDGGHPARPPSQGRDALARGLRHLRRKDEMLCRESRKIGR
ncbi:hypothetical protein PR202_ga09671 [Eleusine coracana subsp. coracana]|uniref:Homeobox domain-containing protein n=1 Tax=Eleusine coracana subsp. coracana TaxID=191504 RepID=A0AAV5C3Q2_ELECO|nr:hypothetical protein PR202_ga09671 [Eleusine coracana subsp. coracana]